MRLNCRQLGYIHFDEWAYNHIDCNNYRLQIITIMHQSFLHNQTHPSFSKLQSQNKQKEAVQILGPVHRKIPFDFQSKGSCRVVQEKRFKHCRQEKNEVMRLLYRKNSKATLEQLSSRETTHRSTIQPLCEMNIENIRLIVQKMRKILMRCHLQTFLQKIQFNSTHSDTESLRLCARRKGETAANSKIKAANLSILQFPLLNLKINQLRILFLTKLQINCRQRRTKPYQITIAFLLARLQARQQFLNLEYGMRMLKMHH